MQGYMIYIGYVCIYGKYKYLPYIHRIYIYIWCIVLFCSFFLIPIYLVAAPRVFAVAQIFPIFPRLETMAPEASSKPRNRTWIL